MTHSHRFVGSEPVTCAFHRWRLRPPSRRVGSAPRRLALGCCCGVVLGACPRPWSGGGVGGGAAGRGSGDRGSGGARRGARRDESPGCPWGDVPTLWLSGRRAAAVSLGAAGLLLACGVWGISGCRFRGCRCSGVTRYRGGPCSGGGPYRGWPHSGEPPVRGVSPWRGWGYGGHPLFRGCPVLARAAMRRPGRCRARGTTARPGRRCTARGRCRRRSCRAGPGGGARGAAWRRACAWCRRPG